jgi:2-amino-4-hydroxy-6-hydroxymethyldihydropteridine diphosphokinase
VYETEAWGLTDQPLFLNQVVELDTVLAPHMLLNTVLQIELQMGRARKEKYGPRLMDIDILLFGNAIVNDPELVVPHPHMAQRRFVLVPLAELVPQLVHPILNMTIQQMLAQCPDPLHVYKL